MQLFTCPICAHALPEEHTTHLQNVGFEPSSSYRMNTVTCPTCAHTVHSPHTTPPPHTTTSCLRCTQTIPHSAAFCIHCKAPQDRGRYAQLLWDHVRGNGADPTTTSPFDYIPLINQHRQDPYPLALPLCDGPLSPEDIQETLRNNPSYSVISATKPIEHDPWADEDWILHIQLALADTTQRTVVVRQVPGLDAPDIDALHDDPRMRAWEDSEHQRGLVVSSPLGDSREEGFRFLAKLLFTLVPNPLFLTTTELGDVDRLTELDQHNALRILRNEIPPPQVAFVHTHTEIYQQSHNATNPKLLGYETKKPSFRTTSNARYAGFPDLALLHPPKTPRPNPTQRLAQERFLLDLYEHIWHHPLPPPGVPFTFKHHTLCWHMTREVCINPDEANGSPLAWDNTTEHGSSEEEEFNAFIFVPPIDPWGPVRHVDLSAYEMAITKKDLKVFKRFEEDPWEDILEGSGWDEDAEDGWDDDFGNDTPPSKKKKPKTRSHPIWVYALASLVLPGSGQFLLGRTKRGVIFLIVSICTLCLLGLVNLISAIDAYLQASKYKQNA